tara:strand:- start:6120 stop:7037 length:918 start_codon:yes stop_codon:yes gene_type:complete
VVFLNFRQLKPLFEPRSKSFGSQGLLRPQNGQKQAFAVNEAMNSWEDAVREVEFWLKDKLSFSLPAYKIQKVNLQKWRAQLNADGLSRLEALESKYELNHWEKVCSASEFTGNCCFLDILDRVTAHEKIQGPGLDIGSRSFWYAPALQGFLPGEWLGVELDANQRYLTGETRKGYAEYMIRPWPAMHYQAGCLTDIKPSFGFITWFLPYVAIEPLQSSGLPERFFQPKDLLRHTMSLLADTGYLFIINQEREEAQIQESLFNQLGIQFQALGKIDSVFSVYEKERFGFLVRQGDNMHLSRDCERP